MTRTTLVATALAIVLYLPAVASAGDWIGQEGTWTISERSNGHLQLTLQYATSTWSRSIDRADLHGISDREIASPTAVPVSFRVEREAGRFEFEGFFRDGRGSGHFRFHPDRGFASMLRSLGVEGGVHITDDELMHLALAGVSSATIRELAALGFTLLTTQNLVELAIHNVTPDYVRTMRSLGIADTDRVRDLVEMRIHRVNPEYVRDMEAAGYRGLSHRQLIDMRIHRVTPEFVRELEALGYGNLPAHQLVTMRIHRVTPAFIREMREAGFHDLSPETLIRMRIHGIDREFIRGARREGP